MPVYSNQRFSLNPEVYEDEHDCGEVMMLAKESMRVASVRS
jgi:hypothetical protein